MLPIQRDVRPRNSEEVLFKTKVQGPKVVEWVCLEEQEMQCAEQTALDMEVVEHASIHMLKQQIPGQYDRPDRPSDILSISSQ